MSFSVTPAAKRTPAAERERLMANLGFGRVFTEHMVSITWDAKNGWHDAALRPYAPIALDPATAYLHYSQGICEGLKAFRQAGPGGRVSVFRPDAHAARFRRSARRMALPELPEETFVQAIDILLQHDHVWAPSEPEQSLYLRPF